MAVLERRLDRVDALAISLGAVIGVGVFRNTGLVLSGTGGVGGATLLWLAVGAVCLMGTSLYADLSSRIPEVGGGYVYVRVAFGGPASFLYGWTYFGVANTLRQAVVYAAIGERLSAWIPGDPRILGAVVLLVLAALTLAGLRTGAITQRILTSGRLATILLVVVLALILGGTGSPPATGDIPVQPFVTALSAAWFTMLGWQEVVILAGELQQPRRDLPVVLVTTVALTLTLYLAIHLTTYFALGGGPLAYGAWPAVDIAGFVLGRFGAGLLSLLLLSSMIGVAADGILVRTHVALALARDGMAPRPVAAINRAGTPYGALLLHVVIVLILVASNSFNAMLPLVLFAQGFLGIFETASYFVVRKKRPELPTSRFHPWAPLIFIAVNTALCVAAGIARPMGVLMTVGILAALALVYAIFRALRPAVVTQKRNDAIAG
ncbi:MAG TPA: APC family permease [Kofleriaceae bacterium]|nr:APC family permease [Kofleriaceae bacterium]